MATCSRSSASWNARRCVRAMSMNCTPSTSTLSSPGSPRGSQAKSGSCKSFKTTTSPATRTLSPIASLLTAYCASPPQLAPSLPPNASSESAASLLVDLAAASERGRRIAKDEDVRSDAEVQVIIHNWRAAHPRICIFWQRLVRAARSSIATGKPVQVSAVPRIITNFDGYALTITLPNGRIINYPGARLVPSERFVAGAHDIEFMDNTHGKWKPVRAWHGVLVENVVQGIARDLLPAAIVRAAARGWRVVHHAHDELVIEAPIGAIPAQDVLALLLEAPPWAAGLPLSGKVRSGPLYFEGPATAEPPAPIETQVVTSPHVELVGELHGDQSP